MTNRKLGKLAPVYDSRTLHFGDYLNTAALPPIPASQREDLSTGNPADLPGIEKGA